MVLQYNGVKYQCSVFKFLINLGIITAALVIMISYVSNVARATVEPKMITIIVHRGDTLWSIARKIEPNSDPRRVIGEIKVHNNLPNSTLAAGQKLKLVIGRD
jgi:LysM repeat protein